MNKYYPKLIKAIHKYVIERKIAYLKDEENKKIYLFNPYFLLVMPLQWEIILGIKEDNRFVDGEEYNLETVCKIANQPYVKKDIIKITETIDLQCYLVKYFNYRLNTKKENKIVANLVDILVQEIFKNIPLEISYIEKGIIQIHRAYVENENHIEHGIKIILALKEVKDVQINEEV